MSGSGYGSGSPAKTSNGYGKKTATGTGSGYQYPETFRKESTPKANKSGKDDHLYSISLNKLLGGPNCISTYTHPCGCNSNWCPPPGIPPFCFQPKTISLLITKRNGKTPPSCYRPLGFPNEKSVGGPPKRKVYCCVHNPGMPSPPIHVECGKKTNSACQPDGKSPFFNNCNFYNINTGAKENAQDKHPDQDVQAPAISEVATTNYGTYNYGASKPASRAGSEDWYRGDEEDDDDQSR